MGNLNRAFSSMKMFAAALMASAGFLGYVESYFSKGEPKAPPRGGRPLTRYKYDMPSRGKYRNKLCPCGKYGLKFKHCCWEELA